MNQTKIDELTRIMNCLASIPAIDDLYGKFDDEDLCEYMNFLTPELADVGIAWWSGNTSIFEEIKGNFEESLLSTAKKAGLDLSTLTSHFNSSAWADFIRESFYFASDLIVGERSLDDIDDFINFAIKMSLEYAGVDEAIKAVVDDYASVFQIWWSEQEPARLFSLVYELTQPGRELINRS